MMADQLFSNQVFSLLVVSLFEEQNKRGMLVVGWEPIEVAG